jgi:hypothetical protein
MFLILINFCSLVAQHSKLNLGFRNPFLHNLSECALLIDCTVYLGEGLINNVCKYNVLLTGTLV